MIEVRTRLDVQKILRAKRRGNPDSLVRAGAYLRRVMRSTIGRTKKPRAAGKAMSSPTGSARRSILFGVDKRNDSVVVGPSVKLFGKAGQYHEFGRKRYGRKYPERPFAAPSLTKSKDKLDQFWSGSITR